MPVAELGLNTDRLKDMGAKAVVVAMGFGDTNKLVRAPHMNAVGSLNRDMPTYLHSFNHHQPEPSDPPLGVETPLPGPKLERYIGKLEDIYEAQGPIFVLASSAAGAYTAAAASFIPEAFAGAVLLAPRLNSSQSLAKVRGVSEEYAQTVELVEENEVVEENRGRIPKWLRQRFLIVRTGGDKTVPKEASTLLQARYKDFEHEDLPTDANHQDGINFMLTDGLPTLIDLVQFDQN